MSLPFIFNRQSSSSSGWLISSTSQTFEVSTQTSECCKSIHAMIASLLEPSAKTTIKHGIGGTGAGGRTAAGSEPCGFYGFIAFPLKILTSSISTLFIRQLFKNLPFLPVRYPSEQEAVRCNTMLHCCKCNSSVPFGTTLIQMYQNKKIKFNNIKSYK